MALTMDAIIGVPYSHIHTCKALKEEKLNDESDMILDFEVPYNHIRVCQNRSRHGTPNVSRTNSPTSSICSVASGALSEASSLSESRKGFLNRTDDSLLVGERNSSDENVGVDEKNKQTYREYEGVAEEEEESQNPISTNNDDSDPLNNENIILHRIAGKHCPVPAISVYYSVPHKHRRTAIEIKMVTVKLPQIPTKITSKFSPRSVIEKHARSVARLLRRRVPVFRKLKKSQLLRIVRALVIEMVRQRHRQETRDEVQQQEQLQGSPTFYSQEQTPVIHRRPLSNRRNKFSTKYPDFARVQTPPPASFPSTSLAGYRSILDEEGSLPGTPNRCTFEEKEHEEKQAGRQLNFNDHEYIVV